MAFSDFWQRLSRRNPSLLVPDQKVTLATSELKRLMEKAYNAGFVAADFEESRKSESTVDFLKRTFFGGE